MEKILLATDFSSNSHNAFNYAVRLGALFHAEITLLNINNPIIPDPNMPFQVQQSLFEQHKRDAMEQWAYWQESIPEECKERIRIKTEVKIGLTSEEILYSCEQDKPDLLVMGMRAKIHLGDKILGNTVSAVIQRSLVPVLVVPESATFNGIDNIAYATNFDQEDIWALDEVLDFAKHFKAKTHCVHIRQNGNEEGVYKQEILKRAYQYDVNMDKMDFELIKYPEVIEGLNHYVDEHHIDLLVMLTHRRGLISQIFHTSYTKDMLLQSKAPLWIFQMKRPMKAK